MPISHRHELIYIHIPRTGGTSVCEALSMDDRRHHNWHYHFRRHPRGWRFYLKFAIVRNPYSRAVSTYEYAKLDESYWHSSINPEQAIDGKHEDYDILNSVDFRQVVKLLDDGILEGFEWLAQWPFIYREQKLQVDKVLKFEDLPRCFYELMKECSIDATLPKLNSSGVKDYRSYYDEDIKQKIREIYSEDFRRFGYQF